MSPRARVASRRRVQIVPMSQRKFVTNSRLRDARALARARTRDANAHTYLCARLMASESRARAPIARARRETSKKMPRSSRAKRRRGVAATALARALIAASWSCVFALRPGASMSIDCVTPEVGPAVGGTLVTLAGEGYGGSADAACAFDDAVVAPTSKGTQSGHATMVCLSPRHADDRGGFVSVGLTLRRANRAATTAPMNENGETFNFAKQMSVTNAYPTDAPEIGGEVFYLQGKHLHEAVSVRWTKPVTHVGVDVVSSALIRCETPPLTSGEISSMVIATFTASQSEYDANALAATTANQTVSIPPRSRGVLGFVLETNDFSLTSATSSVNVTGGTPVLVTGNGFSTVGGEDDGDFLSCFFGTIGPIDARVTASKTATCYSPARAAAASVPLRLGIGNGRFVLTTTVNVAFTETTRQTTDPLEPAEEAQSLVVMNPTLDVASGATPFDVVLGGNFFVRGSGFSFDYDDGCVCTYPDASTSRLVYVSSAIARCSDTPTWTSGEVKISCSADANAVVRSVYVAPVAVPTITSVDVLTITHQGGVALQVTGTSYPDEGESRAYSGCHFGAVGPVHARYMSGTVAECVTPALKPSQSALMLGFGATESVDLVQYGLTIPVTAETTSAYVAPPLWLTPATTYLAAATAKIIVGDHQQLGTLSVGTLKCVFGSGNLNATVGTYVAPSVHCPTPALLSPGFVVVRLARDAAAASLDPPAILLVKEDHAVTGAHPRQTWGPVDVISITGSNLISTHVEGTIDSAKSLCVFGGGAGVSGGVVVSSALIMCESPLAESTGVVERWVTPCFEECDSTKALPTGSTASASHTRVALTSMAQSYMSAVDAASGWTFGGTPVRATLSIAVASEMLTCHFGSTRVQARPAGVAVVETVASAQGENIEIDCVSPARERGSVTVYATLAQSRAPLLSGVAFLYK